VLGSGGAPSELGPGGIPAELLDPNAGKDEEAA